MRPAQFKKDVKMIKTRRCKYSLEMKPKGVRIELDNACDVTLSMILSNIKNGEELHWRLFYVWAIKNGQESNLDMRLKELRNNKGYSITWNDLLNFSRDLIQLIDGVFIGSKSADIQLHDDYENYVYCIEMIDGACGKSSLPMNLIMNV